MSLSRRRLLLLTAPAWAARVPACGADEAGTATTIEKLGGVVKRDERLPGKPVVEVNFQASTTGRTITDADLVHLKELKHLKVLYLGYGTRTTDAGLKHLQFVTSLEKLMLPETQITDAGLAYVGKLKNLTSLGLHGCKGITDRGLAHLKGLAKLKDVALYGTRVTEKGETELQKALPNAYVSGGMAVVPPGAPSREERRRRLQTFEKGVSAEMIDFMSYFDGTETGSEAAMRKYVVDEPDVFSFIGMRIEQPHVTKIEKQGARTCYLMRVKQGMAHGTYQVCWQGGKIRSAKQVSLTFD